MGQPPVVLTGNDDWLLRAIETAAGPRGAELTSILAAGDYLNHSIFSLAELRTGFAKLLAARYVVMKQGRWSVRKRGRHPDVVVDATRWVDPRVEEPGWSYPLDEQTFKDAVAAYEQRALGPKSPRGQGRRPKS